MSAARPLVVVLCALVAGCAGRRAQQVDATEPPVWSTREGRTETRVELAAALIDSGAPEAALEMVADIRKDGASTAELDAVHARALREVGLFDDADEVLESGLRRHRRSAALHNELGILRMEQRRPRDAVQAFELAAKLAPDNAEYHNNLGFALMAEGEHEAAVQPLRRSLKIDSTRRQTRNNLGFALVALGRDREAWRVFRASGSEADAHYNLGVGCELRGDPAAAREAYVAALQADPRHKPATDALAGLAHSTPPEPPHAPRP